MTQRIEPSFYKWLEDLNFLLQICLIESNFFFLKKKKKKDDSKNWEFFFFEKHDSRNWTIFPCDSRNWTLLSNMTHSNWTLLLFLTWLKELNLIWNMTQRIEKSWFFYWKNWIFFEYDSKNWTFFLNVTHRIELFYDSRIVFFFQNDKDFVEYDSKFRTLFFFEYVPKNRTSFYRKYVLRIVFQYDSLNWTHFFSITDRMEHLREWLKELNFYCNKTWHKELNFLWN